MPDPVSRKKHKKKVLDRWENEGGMVPSVQNETPAPRSAAGRSGREVAPAKPERSRSGKRESGRKTE